jgi:hypothetical protein
MGGILRASMSIAPQIRSILRSTRPVISLLTIQYHLTIYNEARCEQRAVPFLKT